MSRRLKTGSSKLLNELIKRNKPKSWSEAFAAEWLSCRGWTILVQDLLFPMGSGCGQIDILAEDPAGWCWVLEVKSTSLNPHPSDEQIGRIRRSLFWLQKSGMPGRKWGGWALVLVDRNGEVEVLQNPC